MNNFEKTLNQKKRSYRIAGFLIFLAVLILFGIHVFVCFRLEKYGYETIYTVFATIAGLLIGSFIRKIHYHLADAIYDLVFQD